MRVEDVINNIENNHYVYKSQNIKHRNIITINDDVERFRKNVKKFSNVIKELKSKNIENFSKNQFEKKFERFKESYNNLKENYSMLENKKSFSREKKQFDDLFEENKKLLKKIGIDFDDKGNLRFDKTKISDVDDKIIKKLFNGTDSFIYKLNRIIGKIDKIAEMEEVSCTRESIIKTIKYSAEEIEIAKMCSNVNMTMEMLKEECNKDTTEDSNSVIGELLNQYTTSITEMCDKDDETKEKINRENIIYKNELEEVGFSVDENGRISFNNDIFIEKNEPHREKLTKLFGESATYFKEIYQTNKNLLDKSLKINGIKDLEKANYNTINLFI